MISSPEFITLAGPDPGLPVGGGTDPRGGDGGAPTYDFVKFSEKLYEIKKILGRHCLA